MLQKSILWFCFAATLLQYVVCQDFCYRANISNSDPTDGDASSRANEIESAVRDMLNELGNDTNLDFTTNDRNQTLEAVEGDGSMSVFRVLICLTNSSKTQAEFTQILLDFTFQTQIDNVAVTAGDYDECSADNFTTNCHQFANCNNQNGSFACACQDEYYDASTNNQTGQTCELPTNFTCTSNTVNVTAYNPYFVSLGINYTELRMGSCSGSLEGDDILFAGECGASIEENATHVFYKWNLTNVNTSSDVTVGNYVTIPITCTFASSQNVSFNISAERRDIIFDDNLNNVPGESYDFTAEAFSNVAVSQPLSGAIDTNTKIYFRLGTSNSLPSNVRIRCESFSTEAADGSSSSIQLMSGSCPVARTINNGRILDTLSVNRNGEGSSAVIGITSHFFGSSRVTTARFGMVACVEDDADNSTCQISCSGRRKRGVITMRFKRGTVGSGEAVYAFERKEGDDCTKDCNRGGICVFDAARRQECVCADGFNQTLDGTCRASNVGPGDGIPPSEEEDDQNTNTTVFTVLIVVIGNLAVLAAIIPFAILYKRKNRNSKDYDLTFANTYAIDPKNH